MRMRPAAMHWDDRGVLHIGSNGDMEFIRRMEERPLRVRDVAVVRNGVVTAADDVFTFFDGETDVEEDARRRVYRNLSDLADGVPRRWIVWPFDERGELLPLDDFAERFPRAFAHLAAHKGRLRAKTIYNGSTDWHCYRPVIDSGGGALVLVPKFGERLRCWVADDPGAVVLSVMHFLRPNAGVDVDWLVSQLSSDDMIRYAAMMAQPMRVGWLNFRRYVVERLPLPERILEER